MIKRIMVIGGAGSGKSSLARTLGEISGLPVIHVDVLYWQPGWTMRPQDEIRHPATSSSTICKNRTK
ncbi:adenylate kinase family enzyme [Ochrobactrum daejeonense]|uniref:Adenylate kinase family enzyme n=1 Tax=Brucella daejeonensis TaxID=659015 RepID=A0A7W9B1C8_9HYPH|nr:hypothetical protein [Brucella daejeonensis]MBB5704439.1 adenylate kinase family enzyme [Brucella daejeonensis]